MSGFHPCAGCTSPMACRDVAMCGRQYDSELQVRRPNPPVGHTSTPASRQVAREQDLLKQIEEHARNGQTWAVHAPFHIDRIRQIIADYDKK